MANEQAFRSLRLAAWRLAGWQCVVTLVLTAGAALAGGRGWALSAAAGGGIGTLAGLYQGLRMLRVDASENPAGFLRGVYVGEVLKIVLTAALFVAAIRLLQVELLPVIAAYAASLGVYWVALSTGYPWLPQGPAGLASGGDD